MNLKYSLEPRVDDILRFKRKQKYGLKADFLRGHPGSSWASRIIVGIQDFIKKKVRSGKIIVA